MKKEIYICDVCGKQVNKMSPCIGFDISRYKDRCSDCNTALYGVLLQAINKIQREKLEK